MVLKVPPKNFLRKLKALKYIQERMKRRFISPKLVINKTCEQGLKVFTKGVDKAEQSIIISFHLKYIPILCKIERTSILLKHSWG